MTVGQTVSVWWICEFGVAVHSLAALKGVLGTPLGPISLIFMKFSERKLPLGLAPLLEILDPPLLWLSTLLVFQINFFALNISSQFFLIHFTFLFQYSVDVCIGSLGDLKYFTSRNSVRNPAKQSWHMGLPRLQLIIDASYVTSQVMLEWQSVRFKGDIGRYDASWLAAYLSWLGQASVTCVHLKMEDSVW